MINAKAYAENIKNMSLEELIKERNRLVTELQGFEQGKPPSGYSETPDAVYQCNNLYLAEATVLVNRKFIELNWPEE